MTRCHGWISTSIPLITKDIHPSLSSSLSYQQRRTSSNNDYDYRTTIFRLASKISNNDNLPDEADVVIIGSGLAGLSCGRYVYKTLTTNLK